MEIYKDDRFTIHDRVIDLLSRMTISEKVGQVNQHLYGWKTYNYKKSKLELTDYLKKHVEWGSGVGALYGLFRADPWSEISHKNGVPAEESWKVSNEIQNYIISNSRLGIPALFSEESPHGHQALGSISYPTNIGKGNSFNTELIKNSSRAIATEMSNKGIHLALVSTLDLARDPRWGRTEECFGEDPYLASEFTKAVVQGFQGDLITEEDFTQKRVSEISKEKNNIGVVLKHLIAQGDALGGHNAGAVNIGEREFMDIHYPLLKSVSNAAGVMAAYNDIDGVPCHSNYTLLEKMLREENNFKGIVMADGTALDRLINIYGSKEQAASNALRAGVDLSLWDKTYLSIENGIQKGIIAEDVLDKAVYRVLSLKFLLGLFDNPYVGEQTAGYMEMLNQHQKINEEMASESVTLLKNNGILPYIDNKEKVAVIGPNADSLYNLLGDYTSPQTNLMQNNTLYNSIKELYSQSEVFYAHGCEIRNTEKQDELLNEAVELASHCDKIVLILGGSSTREFDMEFLNQGAVSSSEGLNMDTGENVDVASLSLGGKQMELLHSLKQLGKPIISILIQGRPYDIEEITELSDAVIVGWYPGQMGSNVISKILKGEINPSGKLSLSYPRSSGQLPVYYNHRDIEQNSNYYDEPGDPLFDFGYGLSYTKYSYDDLIMPKELSKQKLLDGNDFEVSITVKNIGNYTGKESILLFVKLIGGSIIQRTKILRKFKKIELKSGEEKRITFKLNYDDICYYDNGYHLTDFIEIRIGNLKDTISLI